MDETFQTYLNRVARLTLPGTYQSQLQHIQESPKFKPLPDGSRQPVPFPGYSVVTPPWEDESEQTAFYTSLQVLQEKLLQQLDPGLMVLIPPDSFHLTLADLIWDSAYRDREREHPNFEEQLHDRIGESFHQYHKELSNGTPICWQLLGIMIRPRAIAVCLTPQDEDAYKRMIQFRSYIYQNTALIGLGVQPQYPFTAHITLGYFGAISPDLDRARLANTLSQLSQEALNEEVKPLCARRVELRKFDDMMRYYRQTDWPVLEF